VISTVTKKGKILFFIPFSVLTISLIYSWYTFIFTDNVAVFSHYLGLLLFLPVIYFLFKDKTLKKGIVLTGVYLILATINLLSFLPFVSTSSFGIKIGFVDIWPPSLNPFGLLLSIVYGIMNFGTLVEIYLDYKELRGEL
jgi:hypothetical protein